MDPHHFDADPDADPESTYHPDADTDPRFQIKAQTNEKVLKHANIPYILSCHLQIDADPDPDQLITSMRIRIFIRMRIQVTKMMRIRIHNTVMSILNLFVTHLAFCENTL